MNTTINALDESKMTLGEIYTKLKETAQTLKNYRRRMLATKIKLFFGSKGSPISNPYYSSSIKAAFLNGLADRHQDSTSIKNDVQIHLDEETHKNREKIVKETIKKYEKMYKEFSSNKKQAPDISQSNALISNVSAEVKNILLLYTKDEDFCNRLNNIKSFPGFNVQPNQNIEEENMQYNEADVIVTTSENQVKAKNNLGAFSKKDKIDDFSVEAKRIKSQIKRSDEEIDSILEKLHNMNRDLDVQSELRSKYNREKSSAPHATNTPDAANAPKVTSKTNVPNL
jgi:hypothetical protein